MRQAMTRYVVPLIPITDTEQAFDLIIYGRSARELMTVPNEVIQSITARYPNHISSPFYLYDLTNEDARP